MQWLTERVICNLSVSFSKYFKCDLKYCKYNTGYSLSQTPSIGIVKGFFNGSGVEYDIGYVLDVIGYASRGATKLRLSGI